MDIHHAGLSTSLARRSSGHQQHGGTQRRLSCNSLDPAYSPRYNLVSDSFYCVKLFATRITKPVAIVHIIARINIILDQVKRDNSAISISWTLANTNSDDPLAQGNAEADKLGGVRLPTS